MLSALKYVIFFGVLVFGVPVGYFMALRYKWVEKVVFFLALFFTCRLQETINFFSHEHYRGTSRGMEVTLVDLAVLVLLLLVIKRRRKKRITWYPVGTTLYALYFFFTLLSFSNSDQLLYSWFELWKMMRMYLFFWVMFNYLRDPQKVVWAINCGVLIIGYVFWVVLFQKYIQGIYQTNGPFPHQNSLVMYMIVFGSIGFSRLLNHKGSLLDFSINMAAFGIASICIVSTLSRAGMACYAFSLGLVTMLSFCRGFSARKSFVILLMMIGGLGLAIKSADSIIKRFETAPEQSKQTRIELAHGAIRMANDKTLGVGVNNFGLKINAPYPYGDHIERPTEDFKEGLVETTYLMIAAETGWHNLGIFLLWIFQFYLLNFYLIFRMRKTRVAFVFVGLFGGLTGIYLESTLEWVLKQTNNFYQLMLVFAVIGALYKFSKTHRGAALHEA